jgi:hypothetical protein
MASFLRFSAVLLLAVALLSAPAQAAESRKLLQQINIPVTAQCLNILDNSQIANIPGLNVGIIQVIASVLGGGGQTPSAIFFNSGTSTNHCTNNQSFNNTGNCNSIIGPVVLPILGQGTLTPCFNTPENGGRKLLQQINVPITVQCVNLLNNAQLLNIPNLNVGVIQVLAALLGGGGQTPSAIFYNTGTSTNECENNQDFNNAGNCSSVVGPVVLPVLGQGTVIPCYGN